MPVIFTHATNFTVKIYLSWDVTKWSNIYLAEALALIYSNVKKKAPETEKSENWKDIDTTWK